MRGLTAATGSGSWQAGRPPVPGLGKRHRKEQAARAGQAGVPLTKEPCEGEVPGASRIKNLLATKFNALLRSGSGIACQSPRGSRVSDTCTGTIGVRRGKSSGIASGGSPILSSPATRSLPWAHTRP